MDIEFDLKPIRREAIPEAIEKAERYRLLNEPAEAESICLDVLRIDPDNQSALVMLLLALTDQLGRGLSPSQARDLLARIEGDYERAYYAGVIAERAAKARLKEGIPGSGFTAYDSFREAMHWYEKAESVRPAGNDDAVLRWNTCARILMQNRTLRPRPEESFEPILDD